MRTLRKAAALVLVLGWGFLPLGCWSESGHRERCELAVVQDSPDRPTRLIRGRCVINGREIDCATASRACPECRH
jgi:hypothetical protein